MFQKLSYGEGDYCPRRELVLELVFSSQGWKHLYLPWRYFMSRMYKGFNRLGFFIKFSIRCRLLPCKQDLTMLSVSMLRNMDLIVFF